MREFLDGRVMLHSGDCLEVLKDLPEASVDSVVCDPPYHLTSIVQRYGKTSIDGEGTNERRAKARADGMARLSGGFMGKQWDGGDIAQRVELWQQVLRVLKPGGHLVAFSGTRTYHRMVCAIEDAGFEIRDQIGWAYGSGFPKGLKVDRAIDKTARGVPQGSADPTSPNRGRYKGGCSADNPTGRGFGAGPGQFMAASGEADERDLVPEALPWRGWNIALKPAWKPICLARKPLIGTVAENVLQHGTGAMNIDGCRVEAVEAALDRDGEATAEQRYTEDGATNFAAKPGKRRGRPLRVIDPKVTNSNVYAGRVNGGNGFDGGSKAVGTTDLGRWPANLVHDGSDEVLALFPHSASGTGAVKQATAEGHQANAYGKESRPAGTPMICHGDEGSAARFFYTSKADSDDRLGSKHPTVKPVDLMQWLVRLVTPKGGVVLDPFAGTGATGEAAWREGMNAILIEREAEYQADIARRMELAVTPTKRAAVAAGKGKLDRAEDLPLFGGELV